jgi:glyoxylase-like metal-dependent hydrolase (beta-lactamase superfamily II)
MQRERVADDIYVFVSDRYVQVTATVIMTGDGVVLFDTLLYPDETRQIKRFVETRLRSTVRYVINSHFHIDHTAGTSLFPDAQVIAHAACRDLLDTRGRRSLERAHANADEMRDVSLVLPHRVFHETSVTLELGGKVFDLMHSPGHSSDSIACLVREDRVLLAGDTIMALPHFVDGSADDLRSSIERLAAGSYELIVQGHGEVILRGEIEGRLQSDIAYIERTCASVLAVLGSREQDAALASITVDSCGKSRVLLNGWAEMLHHQNVLSLAHRLTNGG